MPRFREGQRPCPTGGFRGGFGPISGQALGGRPRGDEERGDEEQGDEEQEKALALLLRLGGHFRPQCGRFPGLELALFRLTRFEIGAVFLKSRLNPRCDRLSGGADAIKRGF